MKNYKKLILVMLLAVTFMQCKKDFFELEQPELFPWTNVGDLELSVNDAYYAYFIASKSWGNVVATSTYKNYLIGDLSQPTGHLKLEHYGVGDYHRNFTRESNFLEDYAFTQVYRTLNQINPALQFIEEQESAGEEVFANMSVADKETLKRQKGELYFMRAWANYTLATLWMPPYNPGGDNSGKYVPLKMSFVESQEELRNAPLGSIQQFYDAILADLAKAKDLMPEQNLAGRANKYAAATLLYRVHFLMNNYSDALTECDFIINDAVDSKGYYDLSEDPIRAWNRSYGDAPAREVIWENAIRAESNAYEQAFGYMTKVGYYRANNGGRGENWKQGWQGTMAMSYYALDKIGWMNTAVDTVPTDEAMADKRYKQLYYFLKAGSDRPNTDDMTPEEKLAVDTVYDYKANVTKNYIWVDKYYRAPPLGQFGQLPLMRLAEIYLSRAMLRLSENSDIIGATADINVVRARAGLAPVTTVTEESIEIERIKELTGENGDRMLYLKGYRKTIDGNRVGEDGVTPVPAIAAPYSNMVTPLPLGETDYNGSYNGE